MEDDPILSHDWIKMTIKYPGICLICKKGVSRAEVGYWSRTAKSILHKDCYDRSVLNNKNQSILPDKLDKSKKIRNILLVDFIRQRQKKQRCFICEGQIDFNNHLIVTLLELERNVSFLETFFCSTCLSSSDPRIFEEYKKSFSRNQKSR